MRLGRLAFSSIAAMLIAQGSAFAFCTNNTVATTNVTDLNVPGDHQWHNTGLALHVTKLSNNSNLFYTTQITYEFDSAGPWGAQFQMRVKDQAGNDIMPFMQTGGVSTQALALNSAVLTDTVFDSVNGSFPPSGLYTFELWALGGGGTLKLAHPMNNIAVLELPNTGCVN